jgi:predicted ATP-grasp superfamily ATP-dependent carboligase
MNIRLERNFASGRKKYFFSLLGPRFGAGERLMAAALSRRFGGEYEPILVHSALPNKRFSGSNCIVLNEGAELLKKSLGADVVDLQEYEDLNQEFGRSAEVKELAARILMHQDRIPFYSFTTAFLNLQGAHWLVIGPNSRVATKYDNKIEQYKLFKKLGLPHMPARVFRTAKALLRAERLYPSFISSCYSSGGNESSLIFSEGRLKTFLSKLRPLNAEGQFLAVELFDRTASMPNISAIVTGRNRTTPLIVTDQLLRGTRYLGNVYPASVGRKQEKQIVDITIAIGNALSREGFRGVFGCDFQVSKEGKVVVIDLNPRRQGGYACNALALASVGVSLVDLELACALDEDVEFRRTYKSLQYPRAWAHSKVKPFESGQFIETENKQGDLETIFHRGRGSYSSMFYRRGARYVSGFIGYVVEVGSDRTAVTEAMAAKVNELLADGLS